MVKCIALLEVGGLVDSTVGGRWSNGFPVGGRSSSGFRCGRWIPLLEVHVGGLVDYGVRGMWSSGFPYGR